MAQSVSNAQTLILNVMDVHMMVLALLVLLVKLVTTSILLLLFVYNVYQQYRIVKNVSSIFSRIKLNVLCVLLCFLLTIISHVKNVNSFNMLLAHVPISLDVQVLISLMVFQFVYLVILFYILFTTLQQKNVSVKKDSLSMKLKINALKFVEMA